MKKKRLITTLLLLATFCLFKNVYAEGFLTLPSEDIEPYCDFGCYSGHTGIDYDIQEGTEVIVAEDGVVIFASDTDAPNDPDLSPPNSYGNYIKIDHGTINGKNYVTMYAHLKTGTFLVNEGDSLIKGQPIARSGNSGTSTGPHLHFEVREDSVAVDPGDSSNYLWTTDPPSHWNYILAYFSDGWHYEGLPDNESPSQWVLDVHTQYSLVLGSVFNNGGGVFVHSLPRDPLFNPLYGQDFKEGMIVINEVEQKAYPIVKGFVWVYRGGTYVNPDGSEVSIWGPDDLGAPKSVEIAYEVGVNETETRQYFENGTLIYRDDNPVPGQPGTISVEPSSNVESGGTPMTAEAYANGYGSGGDLPSDLTGFGGGGPVPFLPPTNLVATPLSASQVEVRWDLVSDAVDYQVCIYDYATGNFMHCLNDTDGTVVFDTLIPSTTYELEVKSIYLDGDSNWTSRVTAATLAATPPDLTSAELLACNDVQNLACINPQSLFPYSPTSAYIYLKLANAHQDPLLFRFDLYDPAGNFVETFDRYGNQSPNPETEWITYTSIESAVNGVIGRIGLWSIKINYGYDINSINNFYTTYYFEIDEPAPLDESGIPIENPPTNVGTHEYTFSSYHDTVIFRDYNTESGDTSWEHSEILSVATRSAINRFNRSLINFDTSGIPSWATVISADLFLYATFETEYVDNTFYVSRIIEDWLPNYANWTQRNQVDSWSSPGSVWSVTDESQVIIPSLYSNYGNGDYNQWINWDVTQIIQSWFGGELNNGIIVRQEDIFNDSYNQSISFCSSDNADVNCRPKLTVVYNISSIPDPHIGLPENIVLSAVDGDNFTSGDFAITNQGGEDMNWDISTTSGTLSFSPNSGVNDTVVTITADISGLGSGDHFVDFIVTSPDADNSPQTIPVTINVLGIPDNTASIDFEFSSAQNLLITDADQTGLDITGDITIEGWIDPESFTENAVIAGNISGNGDNGYVLLITDTGKLVMQVYENPGGNYSQVFLNNSINTGFWRHVAGTFNVSTGQCEIYLDGIKQTDLVNDVTGASSIYNNGNTFRVASNQENPGGNRYDGKIEELRVWNVVRSATEISDNMYNQLYGNELGLVGYWRFNNDLLDTTPNGNNLTNNSGASFSTDVPAVQ